MNTSLYVLSGEYQQLANALMESDLDEQTISDTLEAAAGDLEVKATNVAMFVRNLDVSAASIREAEKQMAERRNAIESKADSIRNYLKDNMQKCGISKIESPYFTLTIKKNPPAVIIDDSSKIPGNLYVYPEAPPPYPDKKAIAQAIKDGATVDGAHFEQGYRLEIK